MIEQRIQWIFKKQLYFAKQKKLVFSTKSLLTIQGREYKINIIPNSEEKTRLIGNTIEFSNSSKEAQNRTNQSPISEIS